MQLLLRRTLPALLAAILLLLLPASNGWAEKEGLVMKPGRWIMDVRIQMPMQAKPSRQKLQTCVTDEPITAESLMPWAEAQGCKIRSVRIVDNGMTWKLRCKMNGQRSKGRGEFSVDGEEGEGKARVNFEMGGRRLSIVTKWTATHVGVCAGQASDEPAPLGQSVEGP